MKPILTRKQTALRRLALLLAIFLAASALNLVNLLPRQAVEDMADQQDIEHPVVIRRFYDGTLPVTRFALQYLVEGDDAMMLCTTGYHPLEGWYDRDWCRVETWDGAPVHVGLRIHAQGGKRTAYLFGRIDDASVTALTLRFSQHLFPEGVESFQEVPHVLEVPREAVFRGENGNRYLLAPITLPSAGEKYPQFADFRILGYDREGKVLADEEVPYQSWSTSG